MQKVDDGSVQIEKQLYRSGMEVDVRVSKSRHAKRAPPESLSIVNYVQLHRIVITSLIHTSSILHYT
jgi:hypothetical protein